jgi:hypothetical protein
VCDHCFQTIGQIFAPLRLRPLVSGRYKVAGTITFLDCTTASLQFQRWILCRLISADRSRNIQENKGCPLFCSSCQQNSHITRCDGEQGEAKRNIFTPECEKPKIPTVIMMSDDMNPYYE